MVEGEVIIDEVDLLPGVKLINSFVSWDFTWTDGSTVLGVNSADNYLDSLGIFEVDISGIVVEGIFCSDACTIYEFPLITMDFSQGIWAITTTGPGNLLHGFGSWGRAREISVPEPPPLLSSD